MHEQRITVWVQKFKDRASLVLQWIDPDTGKRKSKSAQTHIPGVAQMKRAELEYELNHGLHQEASRMSWEKFRQLFEGEYLPGCRGATCKNFARAFDLLEKVCNPSALRSVTERTLSAYVAGLRKLPGRGGDGGMMASTIAVCLEFVRAALRWAVEQGMLAKCPKFPKVDVPETLPQPVPVESFERLYARAEGDAEVQAFLLCAWLGGLRLDEARELEWEETDSAPWVDFARDRIVLPAKFAKSKVDQTVPLDRQLALALAALPRHGRQVFRFRSQRGGAPLRRCRLHAH